MPAFRKIYTEVVGDEYLILSSIDLKNFGIPAVVWFGGNPYGKEQLRAKINNNFKYGGMDCFTLTIPNFEVIGIRNKNIISDEVLEQIKQFVMVNLEAITDYSQYRTCTSEFINSLKKYKFE